MYWHSSIINWSRIRDGREIWALLVLEQNYLKILTGTAGATKAEMKFIYSAMGILCLLGSSAVAQRTCYSCDSSTDVNCATLSVLPATADCLLDTDRCAATIGNKFDNEKSIIPNFNHFAFEILLQSANGRFEGAWTSWNKPAPMRRVAFATVICATGQFILRIVCSATLAPPVITLQTMRT